MSAEKRLLVAAGGSGGHIYPGLAVARAFAERGPAAIRFVGTPRGLETRLVPREGFPLDLVVTPPLRGRSLATLPRAAFRLVGAFARMRRLIRKFRPQVVFGTGGAISGTAVLAARTAGIPSLILEPNAEPGFANRLSAPFASAVAVGFDATRERFSRAVFVSGIPVRADFLELAPPGVSPSGSVSVLVTGGSQGASRLNRMVVEALPLLRERSPGLRFTHQTGAAEEEGVRQAYREQGVAGRVVAYLDDMPRALEGADLVVGRAGAITCAELAATGRPAILVPAAVAGAHQRENAAALAAAGAAVTLAEEASGAEFAAALGALVDDPARRAAMSRATLALVPHRPAEQLAGRLDALAEGRR